MLPDRSLFIGQKLLENAKILKFKCDIFEKFSNIMNDFLKSFSNIVWLRTEKGHKKSEDEQNSR